MVLVGYGIYRNSDRKSREFQEQLAVEREKTKLERKKLEQMRSEKLRREYEKEKAKFSDEQYAVFKEFCKKNKGALGKAFLDETHPTGIYSFTDDPVVTRGRTRDYMVCVVTIHWKGGISEAKYQTSYKFRLTKDGLDRLEVVRDTAIIKIDPSRLRSFEADLRDLFSR